MTSSDSEKEPSMEEILSSIREIISDEEVSEPPSESVRADEPAAKAATGGGRSPVVLSQPVAQGARRGLQGGGGRRSNGARLMGDETEIAGINSFAELDEAIRLGRVGDTLADVVITILRPMLKDWIDENLPDMVEDMIQKEIRRLAEGGRKKRIIEDLGDFPD